MLVTQEPRNTAAVVAVHVADMDFPRLYVRLAPDTWQRIVRGSIPATSQPRPWDTLTSAGPVEVLFWGVEVE